MNLHFFFYKVNADILLAFPIQHHLHQHAVGHQFTVISCLGFPSPLTDDAQAFSSVYLPAVPRLTAKFPHFWQSAAAYSY